MSAELQRVCQLIQATLEKAVGYSLDFVTNETMFQKLVVDPGWDELSDTFKKYGRANLHWDILLQTLRKQVYTLENDLVVLKPGVESKLPTLIENIIKQVKTSKTTNPATAPPVARRALEPKSESTTSESTEKEVAVGIDLGTTYSVVAFLDDLNRPVTIISDSGELTTPSVILVEDGHAVVGREAVLGAPINPAHVVSCVKRDMGSRAFRKKIKGVNVPPEVLSAIILKNLKAVAERRLGEVKKAVVTVPAYFDESRRCATIDAGKLAGLDVIDIINEPTAAAIAYGYQLGFLSNENRGPTGKKPIRVLVFDLGGGTFDVTIVEIRENSFKAIATDGDVMLGGKDWDEKLLNLVADRLKREHGKDPRQNASAMEELWASVEMAKKALTERSKASVFLNWQGARRKVDITREDFEKITAGLLGRTRSTTEIVVRQAGLKWEDIDEVLLVGGSTRMPMISKMLKDLTGKAPAAGVSPDEAVAHGAALYAGLLLNQKRKIKDQIGFAVTNVNSHSLGIIGTDPTGRRKNQILIPKNTPLPHQVSGIFKTSKDGQETVVVNIVEGESERPSACVVLGKCKAALPPNLQKGSPVTVTYRYEANGQLHVSAQVKGMQEPVKTTIQREARLGEEEMLVWSEYLSKLTESEE